MTSVQKLVNDKRVAFLMAWHPRLGKRAIISKYLNKDVARLIAKKYITERSQFFTQYKPVILNKNNVDNGTVSICKESQLRQSSSKWITISFVDDRLFRYTNIYLHSPALSLWADTLPRDNSSVSLESKTLLPDFFKLVDTFEKKCLSVLNRVSIYSASSLIKDMYCRDTDKCVPGIRVKCKYKMPVFYKKRKYTTQDAIRRKLLGRGSKVRLVLKYTGICDDGYCSTPMNYWSVEQILLLRERPDWELEKYSFIEDDDEYD